VVAHVVKIGGIVDDHSCRYNTCKRLLSSKDGPGIINETDENGLTALHHAARNGHVKIITLLMNNQSRDMGNIRHKKNNGGKQTKKKHKHKN
jgi:ankyrin repeat protein